MFITDRQTDRHIERQKEKATDSLIKLEWRTE